LGRLTLQQATKKGAFARQKREILKGEENNFEF
jgi:hypothetical protein